MFFSQGSIKRPKRPFNLIYLEIAEIYIMSLKVSLLIEPEGEELKISK